MRRRITVVTWLAAAVSCSITACSGGTVSRQWSDADERFSFAPDEAETIVEGPGWKIQVATESDLVGSDEPLRCVQAVVDDQALGCVPFDVAPSQVLYGQTASTRVGSQRVIWQLSSIDETVPSIDHFIVWSSAFPDGRRIDPIVGAGFSNLLWIMEPGEEPWGFQLIGDDGALVSHETLVGLPGR